MFCPIPLDLEGIVRRSFFPGSTQICYICSIENAQMTLIKEKYINPLTDFGFKKLFGSEPNKILLIDFLNQILPDKTVKDLSYASTERLGKIELDRKAIFDLYCISF